MKHFFLCLLGIVIPFLSFTQTGIPAQDSLQKNIDTTEVELQTFLVFFPTAVSNVASKYHEDLDKMATQIIESGDSTELKGFTDNVGNPAANQALSKKRAQAIADYLVTKGVDAGLLKIDFFGESQPLADNTTEEGRSQNRRVEIRIGKEASTQSGGIGEGITELYAEEKVDELVKEVKMPETAREVMRDLPIMPGVSPLQFSSVEDTVISSNGATAMIAYDYDSGAARPRSVLFQIKGAKSFYDIPLTITETKGKLSIPMTFSTELGEGKFAVVAELMNEKGQLSAVDTTYIKMERLGTGKIQISLSWENTSDQDLYVTTPSGETIFYQNDFSEDGGQLDRDDQDGLGPENIFWLDDAPDGTYMIKVNDYLSSYAENPFVVTFNGLGVNKQFYGTTREGSTEWVATFVKKGTVILWLSEDKY